jgi:hypothetical protein
MHTSAANYTQIFRTAPFGVVRLLVLLCGCVT